MRWKILVTEPSPHIQNFDEEPHKKIYVDGEVFSEIDDLGEDTIFFYDFYQNESGVIVGIELHVDSESPIFSVLFDGFRSLQYVEFTPYPIIWFDNRQKAAPMGIEAFGDLKLFKSDGGKLAIAFCPENWIGATR